MALVLAWLLKDWYLAGVHIVMLYLWQIALLRLDSLKGPAEWLGLYIVAAQDPAYDLVPKVCIYHMPNILSLSQLSCHTCHADEL